MREIPSVYAAIPIRMNEQARQIYLFIKSQGRFPIIPLLLFPPDSYNYDTFPRRNIYRICFSLVGISDEVWIFGIGAGALKEYERKRNQSGLVRSFVTSFDSELEEYSKSEHYQEPKYIDLAREVIATSEFVADITKKL